MDLQPQSLSDRLIALRPLQKSDFESLYQAASDPLIWEQHPNRFRYKKEVFSEYFQGAIDSKGAFLVMDKADGEVIGSTRFYNYDADAKAVYIGWTFLRRSHWGGEYNFRLKRLMMDHAFQSVECAFYQIGRANIRSIKATEKLGGIRIGEEISDGIERFLYKIDKGTWEKVLKTKTDIP
jgi:RimJ/RimL family protein N-acetyltransferase